MCHLAFNVILRRRRIDTVFFDVAGTRAEREEYVRRSLINHDGYDPAIVVHLADRLTTDEWDIEGNYGYGDGWEVVTSEATHKAAREQIRIYRAEEGAISAAFRIVHRRAPR